MSEESITRKVKITIVRQSDTPLSDRLKTWAFALSEVGSDFEQSSDII